VLVFDVLALGAGCNRRSKHPKPEPRGFAWFETSFLQLPRMGPVPAAPAEWRAIQARDAVTVRLGPEYRERNQFCWQKNVDRWPGAGWRDVCVSHEHVALVDLSFRLQPAVHGDAAAELSDDPRMTDMVVYDSWRAEAGLLGGRKAVIERARATGGMAGHKRERTLSALIEMGPGEWVVFMGRTGDDAGYDELLTVASTIELTGPGMIPR
jgi:hypothetical protein